MADFCGGVNNNGTLTILNSTLSGNHAGSAGGIGNSASLTVSNSTLSANVADYYGGGAIYNFGVLEIVNSLLSSNVANIGSPVGFGDTTFSGGGGIYNVGPETGTATVQVVSSTLSGNSANRYDFSGDGGGSYNIYGGGIYNDGGASSAVLDIVNSTLSGNSVNYYDFGGGSSYNLRGGGIFNNGEGGGNATIQVGNTVLNAGTSGENIVNDSAAVDSLGYNLSSDSSGFLTMTGDRINTDPLLGPLQDNGGPTLTHALLPGSPAIDRGKNFTGSATDQRGLGFSRTCDDPAVPNAPGGDGTDIGAFEVQSCNRLPVAKCQSVTVPAGASCTANASINDGSFDPDGNPIVLTQSPPGPYPLGTNVVTLTVADSHGASSSCTALVIVRDTTPPQITCPTNITVEFTGTNGAAVSFAPTASDDCSGPLVVNCVPASGSTFPIGATLVLCTATDLTGNSAGCSFQVTVLGARGVKGNVLAELKVLQGSPARSRDDDPRALDLAVRFMAASLDSRFWVDETHLKHLSGGLAMTEEAMAVDELQELARAKRSPMPAGVLQGLIGRVVKCDRLLAVVGLQNAGGIGISAEQRRRASAELRQGDTDALAGRYGEAIEHYREAWSCTQHLQSVRGRGDRLWMPISTRPLSQS